MPRRKPLIVQRREAGDAWNESPVSQQQPPSLSTDGTTVAAAQKQRKRRLVKGSDLQQKQRKVVERRTLRCRTREEARSVLGVELAVKHCRVRGYDGVVPVEISHITVEENDVVNVHAVGMTSVAATMPALAELCTRMNGAIFQELCIAVERNLAVVTAEFRAGNQLWLTILLPLDKVYDFTDDAPFGVPADKARFSTQFMLWMNPHSLLLQHHADFDSSQPQRNMHEFDLQKLYDEIVQESLLSAHALNDHEDERPNHIEGMTTTLRPYQLQGVSWLVDQEASNQVLETLHDYSSDYPTMSEVPGEDESLVFKVTSGVSLAGWIQLTLSGPQVLWYNVHTCLFAQRAPAPITRVSGGVLADEMGLGKSVEILGLILQHRAPPQHSNAHRDMKAEDERRGMDQVHERPSSGSDARKNVPKYWRIDVQKHQHIAQDVCFCGNETAQREKQGFVQCTRCSSWCHLECAGFNSIEEADMCAGFECFTCVCQQLKLAPLSTGATLIVCPASILGQWEHEVQKHLEKNKLSVFAYPGLKEGMKGSSELVASLHPERIRQHDIVLTSFEVLSEEIYRTESPYTGFTSQDVVTTAVIDARAGTADGARLLRNSKRYPIAPCPLACLEWWRVCLDEAQLVESVSTTAARMVRKLPCVNRWCVSGTPVGRGRLEDLFGLALFLDQPPLCDSDAWKVLVRKPAAAGNAAAEERILKYFKPLMLRRSKQSVERQLGLPPQTELLQTLRFSSVEAHFYRRQFQNTAAIARDVVASHDPSDMARLFQPLLGLRQACSHPQVVTTGGLRGAHPNQVLSMREILYKLIEQQRTACEEAQRKLVMSMSAVAGVQRIQSDLAGSSSDSNAENLTQKQLDYLQTAKQTYEDVYQVFHGNRQPSLLLAKVTLSGSGSFRDEPCSNNMENLRLLWTSDADLATPSSDVPRMGFSLSQALERGLPADFNLDSLSAAPELDSELLFKHRPFVRMDMSMSRRLVQLNFGLSNVTQLRLTSPAMVVVVLIPRRIRVQTLSFGSFVDVQELTLTNLLTPQTVEHHETACALSLGRSVHHVTQSTRRSRSWQLLVESVQPYAVTLQQTPTGVQSSVQALSDVPRGVHVQWLLSLELVCFEAEFDVDSLQEYHVLKNYAAVSTQLTSLAAEQPHGSESQSIEQQSEQRPEVDVQSTLDVDRAQSLEREYMTVAESACKSTGGQLHAVLQDTQEIAATFAAEMGGRRAHNFGDWWELVLSTCDNNSGLADNLMDRVHDMLQSSEGAYRSSIGTFSTPSGLRYILANRLKDLDAARTAAVGGIEAMPAWPGDDDIQENTNCKRCRQDWNKTGQVCKHCRLEEKVVEYKDQLFVYRRKMKQMGTAHVDDTVLATGTSMDGQLYRNVQSEAFQEDGAALRLLKLLMRFLLSALGGSHSHLQQVASSHIALLEQYQKELVPLRDRWRAQQNLMSAIDELKQAVTPLRLATSEWELLELPEEQRRAVVAPDEVAQRLEEHTLECQVYGTELASSKRQLTYLKNLAHEQRQSRGNRECVICQEDISDELCVIGCGHAFHEECISWLFQRTPSQTITCPVCRRKSVKAECMLASELDRSNGSNTRHPVRGSWGTKVTCLVSDLLSMPTQDKAIVFSQWSKMLDVVAEALAENGLKFERIEGRRSYGTALTRFRTLPEVKALLLPIKTGAQGLSLTEATHVFLLEPLLNLEQEAQAVNRVHRIGQTQRTFVHRYVIRDTVEEKLHALRIRKLDAAGGTDKVLQLAHSGHKARVRGVKQARGGPHDDQEELTIEDIQAIFDG